MASASKAETFGYAVPETRQLAKKRHQLAIAVSEHIVIATSQAPIQTTVDEDTTGFVS